MNELITTQQLPSLQPQTVEVSKISSGFIWTQDPKFKTNKLTYSFF